VSYLYKPCRLVKNSLKWCKNSSFKVENFKIFLAPPAVVVGKQVNDCWGKKLGAGKNEKRRKWFSSFLIFNFNN